MYIRNPETNEWEEVFLPPTGDTLPIGSKVEFDGDIVPTGWAKVEEKNIVTGGEAVKCGYQWDGKDVYVKRFDIGQLPNINRKIESLDLPVNIKVFRIDGTAYKNIGGHPDYCPIYSMTLQLLYRTDAQQLYIDTDKDQSQYTAWVEIYFVYI